MVFTYISLDASLCCILLAHIHKGTAISVLRSVNQFTTSSTRPTRLPLCDSPVTAYASTGYTTVSRDSTQCEDHHDRMKCSVVVNNLSSYTSTQVELCVVITTHHGTDLSWHLPWLPATAGSVSWETQPGYWPASKWTFSRSCVYAPNLQKQQQIHKAILVGLWLSTAQSNKAMTTCTHATQPL